MDCSFGIKLILPLFLGLLCTVTGEECRKEKWKVENCTLRSDQYQFEVLPGLGWDNLQNVELGRILALEYRSCRSSEDGRFLLPDSAYLIPHKSSSLHLQSEMISHYANYTSLTSFSINTAMSAGIPQGSVSGSFSAGYQRAKVNQINEKSVMTRVQLRHERYTARFQPDAKLDPAFRNRVLDIASLLITDADNSNHRRANYLADLLVRDFGTHVVTSSVAGGVLAKLDNIKSSFALNSTSNKVNLGRTAALSLFDKINISNSMKFQISKENVEIYEKNVEDSIIVTYGGPVFGANFTLAAWEKGLDNNLVTVDRQGDPLFYALTPRALPELPEPIVYQLTNVVRKAVVRYYKANAIVGCMNMSSPSFNTHANIDNNNCKFPNSNYSLGGVYQLCTGSDELCTEVVQRNPATGDFSCPTGFNSLMLHSGLHRCVQKCKRHLLFFKKCWSECARYTTYWCWSEEGTENDRSFLLGGLYTTTRSNPLTNDHTCPEAYIGVRMAGMTVCLSTDKELGKTESLPFGGFFSCKTGNPLAAPNHKSNTPKNEGGRVSLISSNYWMHHLKDSQKMSYRCPDGFSQHLAIMADSCEISYCLKANALSQITRQMLRRPPFIHMNAVSSNRSAVQTISGADGRTWNKDNEGKWMLANANSWHGSGANGLQNSHGAVIGLSVFGTLLVGLVIIGIIYGARRHAQRRTPWNSSYRDLNESDTVNSLSVNQVTYGTSTEVQPQPSEV